MPGTKAFQIGAATGRTVYCMVKRLADGFYLNDGTGGFVSPAPADPYIAMAEDGTLKGVYSLSESRAAWNNGLYRLAFYLQAGGAPAPATDAPPIAVIDAAVLGDVVMDPYRNAADATATKAFVLSQRRAQKTSDGKVSELTDQVQISNAQAYSRDKNQRRQ